MKCNTNDFSFNDIKDYCLMTVMHPILPRICSSYFTCFIPRISYGNRKTASADVDPESLWDMWSHGWACRPLDLRVDLSSRGSVIVWFSPSHMSSPTTSVSPSDNEDYTPPSTHTHSQISVELVWNLSSIPVSYSSQRPWGEKSRKELNVKAQESIRQGKFKHNKSESWAGCGGSCL